MLVPAQVLIRTFCLAQPDQLKPVHFKLATRQPRSRNSCPHDFRKARDSTSVTVVSQDFVGCPAIGSGVISAEDPAAVSHHPRHQWMICIESSTNSRLRCVFHCSQRLSQGPIRTFHRSHCRVTLHRRSFKQRFLLASRLHFTENESYCHLLIRTKHQLDFRPTPNVQHSQKESYQEFTRSFHANCSCHRLTLSINHVENGQVRIREVYATRQEHEIALNSRIASVPSRLAMRVIRTATSHATETPTPIRHVGQLMSRLFECIGFLWTWNGCWNLCFRMVVCNVNGVFN